MHNIFDDVCLSVMSADFIPLLLRGRFQAIETPNDSYRCKTRQEATDYVVSLSQPPLPSNDSYRRKTRQEATDYVVSLSQPPLPSPHCLPTAQYLRHIWSCRLGSACYLHPDEMVDCWGQVVMDHMDVD